MPTQIKGSDVKVTDDGFSVHGEGGQVLANSLVQKNGITMSELTDQFGEVKPHDVSIGKDGAVHIKGPVIAARARQILDSGGSFFDTNCGCGGGAGTSAW